MVENILDYCKGESLSMRRHKEIESRIREKEKTENCHFPNFSPKPLIYPEKF